MGLTLVNAALRLGVATEARSTMCACLNEFHPGRLLGEGKNSLALEPSRNAHHSDKTLKDADIEAVECPR